METDKIVQLDPKAVLAQNNSRFNLKRTRLDSLKASILEQGGILQPVGVVPLKPPVNGHSHELVFGFYRHAALTELNEKDKAGLTMSALVLDSEDALALKKAQLAENMERENQSPMDRAVAIRQLMDSGVTRAEIRRIFSSAGGRKGTTVQPMSNAMLNIHLRFLELPKAVQEKIHDGRVGVAAAYELGKVAPEKRAAVLERAEKDRLAQIEQEEKDEERYLASEKKLVEVQQKAAAIEQTEAGIREQIVTAEQQLTERSALLETVKREPYLELDEKGKTEVKERMKAAEADVKASQKVIKDLKNDLAKAIKERMAAEEQATKKVAELEAARKLVPAKRKGTGVGVEDIKKAAQAEGQGGAVPLNLSEIRQGLKELTGDSVPDRVAAVMLAVKHWADGRTTPKELIMDLRLLTEGKAIPKHLQATEAPADKAADKGAAPAPAAAQAKAAAKK
jgi:ParB/RepB/Spo0J family partition protein